MPVLSEQRAALLVLILVLILNAVSLSPELTGGRVTGNDNISHWALIQELVHAVETGQNPLDFWSPAAGLGSPVIRTYQPLAQIVVALAYFALGKSVSLLTVFLWVRFLAVVCFPAAVFGSLRLMDFPPLTAAAGAVLAPLISTANFYGLDDSSYVTAGRGLFPQSVAAILLFLSIGYGFRALRSGRSRALAGVFLGLTAVTHFIYGWMGALTLCLAVALPDAVTRVLRLRRLAGVALAALAVSAFQIVPVILDRAILNHSRWEDAWKFDSFGASFALKNLFTGELLDYNRPAVFSLLALAGAVLLLWRVYRTRRLDLRESFVFGGALLWLLIFFGRPTWGPLLTLLGATADLHLHRTIGGLHIFLLLLAALALSTAWYEAQRRGYAILAAIGILVLLAPMLVQRSRYLDRNESESAQRLDLVLTEEPSLDAVLANLKQTGGRAYAGSGLSWGPQFALGGIPVFAFLYTNNIAQTSTTYHLLALTSDLLPDFDETRPSHYALFNVRSVVAPAQRAASLPGFLTPRGDAGRFRIFNAPGTGYFDVVDAGAYRAFTRQDFYEVNHQWLKSDGAEKKVHVVLTPSSPITSSEGSPGEVRSESQAGEAYQAVLNANRQAYALFKMTWHPKWNAYVDGAPAPTAMLSPGFIGVPIMQGAHTVRLQYEPGPLKPILAGAGWLVALAACVWERRRGGTD